MIDNPAGVGYSGGRRDYDVTHSDHSFRLDALKFIQMFFEDWPEIRGNQLYIAGISYGGIYAPHLAYEIHTFN